MTQHHYLDPEPLDLEARPGKGPLRASYAFVGLSPSMKRTADRLNEPLGTSSVALLEKILGEVPDEIYVTNLIKVPVVPGKKPGVRLIRKYSRGLVDELLLVLGPVEERKDQPPKRILAIGAVVAKLLAPDFKELKDDHGAMFYNAQLHALIIPTYPFYSVARDPSKKNLLARDLERFFELGDPLPEKWLPMGAPGYAMLPTNRKEEHTLYLDIESTGLNFYEDEITRVGIALDDEQTCYQLESPTKEKLLQLLKAIQRSGATVVGHNLQFDLGFLSVKTDTPWSTFPVRDTMIMAHILGEEVLSLKHLTVMYTDRPGSRSFGGVEDPNYLTEDVFSTRELDLLFQERIKGKYAHQMMCRVLPIFVEMVWRGVPIHRDRLNKIRKQVTREFDRASDRMEELAGYQINLGSTDQVASFLLEQNVPLREKTKTGKYTVKESVLKALAEEHPLVNDILLWREKKKEVEFLESYEGFMKYDGRIHPRILLTGTTTGRLSCRDPNLQQVPREGELKTIFYIPSEEEGYYGLIDLSQAELRGAAYVSGDLNLARALLTEDVHRTMASWVYNKPREEISPAQRKKSKGVTFGLLYGGSEAGLAKRVGVPERMVAKLVKNFYQRMPDLGRWLSETGMEGVNKKGIHTLFGRYRSFNQLMWKEGPNSVRRKAVNTPIQGTASDITLHIMADFVELLKKRGAKSFPLFGVHDSTLIWIAKDEVELVAECVQQAFLMLKNSPLADLELWPYLPIIGELVVGKTWAEVESTNGHYKPIASYPCTSHLTLKPLPERKSLQKPSAGEWE